MIEWLPADERQFYDSVVHDARSKGWSRADAEDLALERLMQRRDSKAPSQ